MSDKRYVLLQDIVPNTYFLDCPVEIENGALLLDNKSRVVLLQLKINILEDFRNISSVVIKIDAFNDVGDMIVGLNPFRCTFEDINLISYHSFENGIPIVLDPKVTRVNVEIEKVSYVEGREWIIDGKKVQPPAQISITSLPLELQEQLNRDICLMLPEENREQILFLPQKHENYWLCSCGRPNRNSDTNCIRCNVSRKWVLSNITEDRLQENLEKYKNAIEKRPIENIADEEEIKRRKHNIRAILLRVALVILAIGVLASISLFIAFPYIKYARANQLLVSKRYDDAITLLASLDGFRDSTDLLKEAKYQQAFQDLADKEYNKAITVFSDINGYKNSTEMVDEANYQKAGDLLTNKKYDESISIFSDLDGYKDSVKMVMEANYQKAEDLLEKNQFQDAATILSFMRDYKDGTELFNKTYYLWGLQLAGTNDWENALNLLEKVDPSIYPDVSKLIGNAKYESAKKEADSGDYEAAYYLLEDLHFKDSDTLAAEYARIAFAWKFTGGMTKSVYSVFEDFLVIGKFSGGRPGEIVPILTVFQTPDWTKSNLSFEDNQNNYQFGVHNDAPTTASTGVGTCTISNYSTGEVLARFTFSITS